MMNLKRQMPVILFAALMLVCLPAMAQDSRISSIPVADPANTFVVIIANEDYGFSPEGTVFVVPNSIMAGEKVREHFLARGINQRNILIYPDASLAHMKLGLRRLDGLLRRHARADIIFYFSGCVSDNQKLSEQVLYPVDYSIDEIFPYLTAGDVINQLSRQGRNVYMLLDVVKDVMERKESLLAAPGEKIESGVANVHLYKSKTTNFTEKILARQKEERPAAATAVNMDLAIGIDEAGTMEEPVKATTPFLLVSGRVENSTPALQVFLNGEEAHLQDDGSFNGRVTLMPGANVIEVFARDVQNRSAGTNLYALYTIPPGTQQRTLSETEHAETTGEIKGNFYSILIGINDYDDPLIGDLDQPVRDIHSIRDVLLKYYSFEEENIRLLINPTRDQIIGAFDDAVNTITPDDNLLLFYAGHGYWDEATQRGYWLPSDAGNNSTLNWILNNTITSYIASIPSKHTLVITDACFGGAIFKTRSLQFNEDRGIQRLYQTVSRKAMTSGTLEEVPDQSVFVHYMLETLRGNNMQFLPAERLFNSIKPAVLNHSENIPQYGNIRNAGDEGGDFIFIRTATP
jgi:hypothetical protein